MKNNKQVKMGNKPKAFGKGPKADGKKNNKNSAKPNKPAPAVAQKSMAIKKKNNKKPNLPSPKTKLQSQPQIKVVATKSSDESDLSDSELELDEMNVSQLTNESIGQDAADLLSSSGSEDDAADLSLSQSVADDLLSSDDEENIAMGDEDDEDLSSEPEEPVKNGKQSQAVKNGKKLVRTPEEQEARKNSVSVFVGNLPITTKREKIEKMFSMFGKILSIRLRTNCGSYVRPQSKTTSNYLIAFVDFQNGSDADASLAMNGEKLGDNVLRVDIQRNAKQAEEAYDKNRTVFVGNLIFSANDETLHQAFACCGPIEYVRVLQSKRGGNGAAFVCFKDAASVINALKLHGTPIEGRVVRVTRYEISKLGAGRTDTGAARRLKLKENRGQWKENKGGKMPNKGSPIKNNGKPMGGTAAGSKKQNFAGVKNNNVKKKNNKHKGPKGQKALAKKIAPK